MISQNHTKQMPQSTMKAPWLNRRVVLFPIWFFQLYLTFTVFIFAFGPWPWPVNSPITLYLFLFSAQTALWLGYKSGIRTQPAKYYGRWRLDSMLKISLILNLLWIVPSFMLKLGMQDANISNITTAVVTGIDDPGTAYSAKFEVASLQNKSSSVFSYINIIISPILWLLFPLGVVHWRSLRPGFKICFVIIIFVGLLKWVAIGTTKGIADFFLLLPCLLLAANPMFLTSLTFSKIVKAFSITLIGFVLLLSFFIYIQQGRAGGELSIRTYLNAAGISIDKNNWMVSALPFEGQAAVAASTSYLAQGYYGLSLALGEPFDWSYGVGNSFFLTGIAEHFTGEGVIFNRTYPAKIESYGWMPYINWHSVYTWIASDTTFPGAIVVVFLIGRLFAKVWIDVLKKENPYAVPLFALLVMMLFYFPANNQVLAFSDTASAFLVFLICWIHGKKRISFS